MPKRIFQRLLGSLLIATMLATSIIPPGIRHTHAGGSDLSHGHPNNFNLVLSETMGNGCPENDHSGHDFLFGGCTLEDSLGDETIHRHFQLFGFSVALPDTNHSPKCGNDSSSNHFVSIRATENISPFGQSNWDTRNLLVPISQDYSPHSVTVFSVIPRSLQPVSHVLLCDSARHERSGVQLI